MKLIIFIAFVGVCAAQSNPAALANEGSLPDRVSFRVSERKYILKNGIIVRTSFNFSRASGLPSFAEMEFSDLTMTE
jgi:hypothetical protein